MKFSVSVLLCCLLHPIVASASSLHKRAPIAPFPADDQVYLGLWLNGQQGYSDTPAAANARMNLSFPVFQFGQRIPRQEFNYVVGVGWPAFVYLADWTNSNAAYFLTIYPDEGYEAVTDGDLAALGQQLAEYEANGRTVYLRYAPEMQGIWNAAYGSRPTAFIEEWRRMYTIVKSLAPSTVIVWSPNFSIGYPWGQSLDMATTPADRALLDTNNDGQLTYQDDAYSPYYPGDEYLDAAGLSIYYKGPNGQDLNEAQQGGFCEKSFAGIDPWDGRRTAEFYQTYCATPNRPCFISEGASAYHVDIRGGDSHLDLARAWWQDCITNTTFFSTHPQIKMVMMYEFEKYETAASNVGQDLRDFRSTNDSQIATAFRADIESMIDSFAWAEPVDPNVAIETDLPGTNPVLVSEATMTATVSGVSGVETLVFTETFFSSPSPSYISGTPTDSADGLNPTGSGIASAVVSGVNVAAAADASGASSTSGAIKTSAGALLVISVLALFV